jgi:ABC-2 type transport system permease protein
MRWHRFVAMARKEVLQILRDSRSLAIVFVMPVVLMLLLGYGVSLDTKHIPVYVYDQERSPQSRELVARFAATKYFSVLREADNYGELVAALDAGRCQLALAIPYDFSRRLAAGGTVSVQALVDATDDNNANLIFSYSSAIVQGYSQEVMLDFLGRRGRADVPVPLRLEPRTWFNETLESKAFVVPGVVALVMAVIGTFLTSLTIAREWERGTMEQLISTPVTPLEVLFGKLVPYFFIGMVDAALCTAIGIYWFEVPFRGTRLALYGASALFLTAVLAQGYFISVVAKSQLAASQLALVSTFLPAFLLSGFLFAIEQMPPAVQAITRILPARYYVAILKSVFLKGTPLPLLRGELVALGVFALVLGLLATRAFKKKL